MIENSFLRQKILIKNCQNSQVVAARFKRRAPVVPRIYINSFHDVFLGLDFIELAGDFKVVLQKHASNKIKEWCKRIAIILMQKVHFSKY